MRRQRYYQSCARWSGGSSYLQGGSFLLDEGGEELGGIEAHVGLLLFEERQQDTHVSFLLYKLARVVELHITGGSFILLHQSRRQRESRAKLSTERKTQCWCGGKTSGGTGLQMRYSVSRASHTASRLLRSSLSTSTNSGMALPNSCERDAPPKPPHHRTVSVLEQSGEGK
jgi:hypothetical protein